MPLSRENPTPEVHFACGACGAELVADSSAAGDESKCPECGAMVVVPGAKSSTNPDTQRAGGAEEERPDKKLLTAGWICFGVGMVLMFVMFIIPVWGVLFTVSTILSIIALAKRTSGQGITLLVSSLVAPILCGLLIGLVLMGGMCAATVTALDEATKGVQPVVSKRNERAVQKTAPTPRQTVQFAPFLADLDRRAEAYRTATTTAQRDLALKEVQSWASSTLKKATMSFTMKVKDVRLSGKDQASITYSGLNDGGYSARPGVGITVRRTGELRLKMSPAQAGRVSPGTKLTLTADVHFTPGMGILSSRRAICRVQIKRDRMTKTLGSICMTKYSYRIAP